MNINRNNYEVFFLLYIDRELNAEEMQSVENFLEENPDLQVEMNMLTSTILPEDQLAPVFPDKSKLFRTSDTSSPVSILNYESFFVLYADDELSNEEKAATEKFVYDNPEFQAEFELIQQAKLIPDNTVLFPGKEKLYRGQSATVRPLFPVWTRYAAAAMILLMAGMFWMSRQTETSNSNTSQQGSIATNQSQSTKQPAELGESETTPRETPSEKNVLAENSSETAVSENALSNNESTTELAVISQPLIKQEVKLEASVPDQTTNTKLPVGNSIAAKVEEPATGSLAINSVTTIQKSVIPVQIDDEPVIVVAVNDNSRDDDTFSPGKEIIRKTPLRGLLRKAGRIAGKTNPFSEDRAKGGVFTASNEQ
ncbi:MAG: hypothetical protein MUE38_02090 [Flavihumibacter sp.]|nr:hypothetical protein [Flavihumibacter sp.]